MKLSELFSNPGLGVMATAAADGSVNTAVYARPHVIDEATLVWGMTDIQPQFFRIRSRCLIQMNTQPLRHILNRDNFAFH